MTNVTMIAIIITITIMIMVMIIIRSDNINHDTNNTSNIETNI